MPYIKVFSISILAILLCGCASLFLPKLKQNLIEITSGEFRVDRDHSTLLFKIDHMGLSKFVGRFNRFDASLNFDANQPKNSTLEAVVEMASVDVNNEDFERALVGKFWFNTEQYPQAYFKTLAAQQLNHNTLSFRGLLTFLGQEQEITVIVKINGAGNNLLTGRYTLGFSASTTFSRSAFGLDRYVPTVGDEVELEIHAEFQRQ